MGDGLTGPQPSVIGSVDKVFKQVTQFDQAQCIQKMICQFMGAAGDTVTNAVSSQLGGGNNQFNNGQLGQFSQQQLQQFQQNPGQFQQQLQQFQQNPGQFVQQIPSQGGQFASQLVSSGNRPLGQFINTGQQLVQNQYPGQFNQFQTQFASPSSASTAQFG